MTKQKYNKKLSSILTQNGFKIINSREGAIDFSFQNKPYLLYVTKGEGISLFQDSIFILNSGVNSTKGLPRLVKQMKETIQSLTSKEQIHNKASIKPLEVKIQEYIAKSSEFTQVNGFLIYDSTSFSKNKKDKKDKKDTIDKKEECNYGGIIAMPCEWNYTNLVLGGENGILIHYGQKTPKKIVKSIRNYMISSYTELPEEFPDDMELF